jgi:hypothetical protein
MIAAAQHDVPDRDGFIDALLDEPLVHAFVAPGHEDETAQRGVLGDLPLRERDTVRRQVHPTRRGHAGPRIVHGLPQRLGLQHHPGTAAVGAIVHRLVHVRGELPRIHRLDREHAALERPSQHAETERVLDELGKQRHDDDPHRVSPRPFAASRRRPVNRPGASRT